MPYLNRTAQREDSEGHAGQDVERVGDRDQLFAIQCVGENAAEQAEDDKGKCLKKAGQSELHGRARKVIHLIKTRHVAHVIGSVGTENRDENQAIIANQQRRPRADGPRRLWLG